MQPGKLAIDEAFGARGHPRAGLDIRLFFFNYNGLRGFHKVLVHPRAGGSAIPVQSMCYRDDVSMTLMFRVRAPSSSATGLKAPWDQASRNNSAASALVTGRPSRRASESSNSTACRMPA